MISGSQDNISPLGGHSENVPYNGGGKWEEGPPSYRGGQNDTLVVILVGIGPGTLEAQ